MPHPLRRGEPVSRLLVTAAVLSVIAAALTGCAPGPATTREGPPAAVAKVVVPSGAYLGMHFPGSPQSRAHAMGRLEDRLGRTLALDRAYHRWDVPFPTAGDRRSVAAGHTLFLGWSCRATSGVVDWRALADGAYDDLIDARAAALTALGRPVLMSFCHEPATYVGRSGTSADFVAAWRHLVVRMADDGAPVSWVWTLTSHAFRQRQADAFYPGDDVVEWVGVDGYVNVDCPWLDVPWRSWDETFGSAEAFAEAHDKPLAIAEFSLREDPTDAGRKGRWFRDSLPQLTAMRQLHAVVGFNSAERCSSYVVSSPAALTGLRTWADSDFFSPTDVPAG